MSRSRLIVLSSLRRSALAAPLLAQLLVSSAALAQPADAPKPDEPPAQPDAPKPEPDAPKPEPDAPKPEPPKSDKPAEPPAAEKTPAPPAAPDKPKEGEHKGSFEFGSYGRVVAAADAAGGPGAEADIVAHGSRMDEDNYVEAELRREDVWPSEIRTNVVITLAIASPVFHYSGNFSINAAARNLYLEAKDVGLKGISAWAGSRMVRGDDLYVLDWWPLDNLNLLGAGAGYQSEGGTSAQLSLGATQPDVPFFKQSVERPAPLDQFGAVAAPLLNRQKLIGGLRLAHNQRFGDKDKPGPGIKAVLYGQGETLPPGVREPEPGATPEALPSDGGFAVGGQFTAYTGVRDTFVHVFLRYAGNLAAYGQFTAPGQLAEDKTTSGARDLVVAAGGNAEIDFFGVTLAAYFRSFRDASVQLNYEDVDEGAVVLRPTFFFGQIAGLSLEGTFEMAQRGVIYEDPNDPAAAPTGPALASLWRVGLMPFISPAGRGTFSRPQIRATYLMTVRDDTARLLYPEDHPFRDRQLEHFFGLGAEWWFNSSSYGF